MKFNEMKIRQELKDAINDMGFEEATEIQVAAIELAATGKDMIAQAQTGTGKTASFVIPMLEQLEDTDDLQSLILAPTRELAVQITKEIDKLAKYLPCKVVSVYGGDSIDRQIRLLKERPQIVVGTPGRLLDLIKRKKIKLQNVKFFILDEVDEMLNMGFLDDVEEIASKTYKDKQTLMFSATMPDRIKKIAQKFLNEPEHIKIQAKSLVVDKVDQYYTVVKDSKKNVILKDILDFKNRKKVIIFTQTKRKADELYDFLSDNHFSVDKIHGDLTQKQRLSTIDRFQDGKLNIIVATDVVARGIDIEGVELVINLELPQDIEYYIHRIGRTGRGNAKKGEALTIVSPNVYKKTFSKYPKALNCKIEQYVPPTEEQVTNKMQQEIYVKIEEKLSEEIDDVYFNLVDMFAGEDLRVVLAKTLELNYPDLSTKARKAKRKMHEKLIQDENKPRSSSGNRNGNGRNRNGNGGNRNRSGNGGNRSRNGNGGNRSGSGRSRKSN